MAIAPVETTVRGRYRKPGYFEFGGQEIIGLKRRPDGRFYASDEPSKTFGKDPAKAIHLFRLWQANQGAIEPLDPDPISFGIDNYNRDYWRNYYRNLILTNARQAAIELDVDHLAFYPETPTAPTMSLEELGEKFLAEKRNKRGKMLSKKHKKMSELIWKEFVTHVGVSFAARITEDAIQSFAAKVLNAFDAGTSQSYVKYRFGSVKTILAFGSKKGIDSSELERVLRLCKKHFEIPAPPPPNPQPITPEQFQALLDLANVRQKAILLSALNFCMKSGEVGDLIKSDIDLEKGTLVTTRNKTGTTRIAVLWTRTADAIRAYLKKHPHHAEHLFNSRIGTPLTAKAAGRIVIQLRRKAKLPESVCFDTIRDGGYTAAIEGGASETHAKLLAGHAVRMSDHYVRRNPKMVADACEAIERHYFS